MFLTLHLIFYISIFCCSSSIVTCTDAVTDILIKRTSGAQMEYHPNHNDHTMPSTFTSPQFDTSYQRHGVVRKSMDEAQKEGRNIKAASSISILADKNAKEDLPQVYFRSGRKAGKVITLFSQTSNHPNINDHENGANYQHKNQRTSGNDLVQIVGFTNAKAGSMNLKMMRNNFNQIRRQGKGFKGVINTDLLSNPLADHKKPAIHVRPGRQDGHLLSFYLENHSPRTSKGPTTMDLIGPMEKQHHSTSITANDKRKRQGENIGSSRKKERHESTLKLR